MRHKVLIVEDEPAIADTIQYALETDGFETVRLTSGLPALTLLATEPVDIVVLDIGLPDINGFELCKEIRKTHNIPIIFLTARSEEIDKVVGLEIGGGRLCDQALQPAGTFRQGQGASAPDPGSIGFTHFPVIFSG